MPCNRGLYGIGCSYRCDCMHANADGCDPVTGKCICKPGWKGVECESICDIGRYGTNCQNKCDCGDNRSSCEPQSGKNRLINKNTNSKTKTLTLLYNTRRKGSRESIMPPNKKGKKNRDHYF